MNVPYHSNNTPTRRINECTCIENLNSDDDDLNCDESFEPTRDCKKNERDYSPYEEGSFISGTLLQAKQFPLAPLCSPMKEDMHKESYQRVARPEQISDCSQPQYLYDYNQEPYDSSQLYSQRNLNHLASTQCRFKEQIHFCKL